MLLFEKRLIVGIDIGGSHITAALIDLEKQCVLEESRVRSRVNSNGPAEEIISTWVEVLRKVISGAPKGVSDLRLAMPGPFDYESGISLIKGMNKYESLYGLDIRSCLATHLAIVPENILFRNDAEAFLHGEVFCGAARTNNLAIGITLGTGLGSAVSIDGITKDACLGVSAFKDGIAEDYISTRWFVKRYHELTGKKIDGTEALVSLYQLEPAVKTIFAEFSSNLSVFLASFIQSEQPEVVVIGGNIAKTHPLFLDEVKYKLSQYGLTTPLKIAELWESGALLGAAYYSPAEKTIS
ncbi:ROK family protein [Pedobacter sp. MC2016-24]|uniref:ROK family protein n=1 Tax=Pedobacter sp. MC2016-24 TaxID=2780090 RepID=UPI0018829D14|nr:ROK family protein [Pedobacter sp. MC2016-24]MBE9601530.1 ROK family protein [Pedobacter sp. MC2016-24]